MRTQQGSWAGIPLLVRDEAAVWWRPSRQLACQALGQVNRKQHAIATWLPKVSVSGCEDELALDCGYQELQTATLLPSPSFGPAPAAAAPRDYLRDHSPRGLGTRCIHSLPHSFICGVFAEHLLCTREPLLPVDSLFLA